MWQVYRQLGLLHLQHKQPGAGATRDHQTYSISGDLVSILLM
jgi:hypothetical protein